MWLLISILIAISIVILAFTLSAKRGVVGILASGLALTLALIGFFLWLHIFPQISGRFLDTPISGTVVIGTGAFLSLLIYAISRFATGMICKSLFNPDNLMHGAVDGIPGGILSVFSSVIFVLFLCVIIRVAGTHEEIRYTTAVTQAGSIITEPKLTGYPAIASWRNAIESVPGIAAFLDVADPFSNRINRNTAAFVIMGKSEPLERFLLKDPATLPLASSRAVIASQENADIQAILEQGQPTSLPLSPILQKAARSSDIRESLRTIPLKDILLRYAATLTTAS